MADDTKVQAQNTQDKKVPSEEDRTLGRVSATENSPTTSEKFSFWLMNSINVNPFDIIEGLQKDGSKTYGLVTNLEHSTDAPSHLSNFISNNFGELTDEPNTPRQGTTVATANVMKNTNEQYMPLQNEDVVRFPDKEGIELALGIDTMKEEDRIAAGLIRLSNNTVATAYVDKNYTLGPQSAHVSISGISGLATKTSYAMFLIKSMLQKENATDTAVVIMNVKQGDLLHIHEKNEDLTEDDLKEWKAMGLKCEPFNNVRYFLPKKIGDAPNSYNPPDKNQYDIYAYDFTGTREKLDLLFSGIDDSANTIESIIGNINMSVDNNVTSWTRVVRWSQLFNDSPLVDSEGNPRALWQLQAKSIGRFLRQLRRIVETRQSGIFFQNRSATEVSLGDKIYSELAGGKTFVIDIALLKDEEQTLVFGDVMRSIYSAYFESDATRQATLPKRVLIFVDELNKFAPAHADTSPIIEQILDIAERGRSMGIVLLSAQQFSSAVHPRVVGNSATKVYGRTGAHETTTSQYKDLDKDLKETLTRLKKGELVLDHPVYRQPVKIKFPNPCYHQPK